MYICIYIYISIYVEGSSSWTHMHNQLAHTCTINLHTHAQSSWTHMHNHTPGPQGFDPIQQPAVTVNQVSLSQS